MMLSWGTKVLAAMALMLLVSLLSLIFEGLGRSLQARLEGRLGPPPSQPFYDLVKLLNKRTTLPASNLPWLFLGAPVLGAAASLTVFLYLPIGSLPPLLSGGGDLLLVLFLLLMASLAPALALMAGGSPQGEMAAGAELRLLLAAASPLALVVASLAWYAYRQGLPGAPFSIETFVAKSPWSVAGWPGLMGLALLCAVLFALLPLLAGRGARPVEGATGDFSGRALLLLEVARHHRTLASSTVVVALFLPGSLGRLMEIQGLSLFAVDFLFFWAKVLLVQMAALALSENLIGRFREGQVAFFYSVVASGLALGGLILLFFDTVL